MAKTNTPAVIEKTETAVATWEGFASDGTEDIAPSYPIIKIVQSTSSMPGASKHAGEFYRSDTEEYIDPLEVVALVQKNTRAYFKEGEQQPSCRSDDSIAPAPNQPLWEATRQPALCKECPFSQWGGDGTPPACRQSIVVLVDTGDGDLAQLRLGGKSMGVWKGFVARRLKPRKQPLCSQRLSLTTVEKSEPGKKWQELVIDATPLSRDDALVYNAVLQYERGRFEQAVRESHEAEEGAVSDNGWEDGKAPIEGTAFVAVED